MSTDRRERLADFAHLLYERREVAKAFAEFVRPDYIQHSPGLPDGPAAAVEMLTEKFGNPDLHLAVRRRLLDGDMAVLLIHGEVTGPNPTRFAVVDVYRFDGDWIVEHWDVNQRFPDDLANAHPFFSEQAEEGAAATHRNDR